MESSSRELSEGTELTIQGLRDAFEMMLKNSAKNPALIARYVYFKKRWFVILENKVYQLKSSYGLVEKELTLKEFEEMLKK